jgi:hypothetical protein
MLKKLAYKENKSFHILIYESIIQRNESSCENNILSNGKFGMDHGAKSACEKKYTG